METDLERAARTRTGRWQHPLKLVFRVWPKGVLAHKAVVSEKEIRITGIHIDKDGHPELWRQTHSTKAEMFEISEADFDVLTAIAKAGGKIVGDMVVHAPGTLDGRVKKECWVEVHAVAYESAPKRRITFWGSGWNSRTPTTVSGDTLEEALGLAGLAGRKTVYFERDADIDEDVILKEVLENDAIIVLARRPSVPGDRGVTARAGQKLMKKAMFWTVPGREPWEDGGSLRGYQIADSIVRWERRLNPENREADAAARLEMMHEATREIGRRNRRTHFLDTVVNRFARRVGMSRQRVMARFLDEGIVDWLMRSVENVKPIRGRDSQTLLRGKVSECVKTLEFYYRAVEAMGEGRC